MFFFVGFVYPVAPEDGTGAPCERLFSMYNLFRIITLTNPVKRKCACNFRMLTLVLYFDSESVFPLLGEVEASLRGLTEGARRATGVSPGDGCLTTLSVLVYEKTWRNAIWKKQQKKWFVNAAT